VERRKRRVPVLVVVAPGIQEGVEKYGLFQVICGSDNQTTMNDAIARLELVEIKPDSTRNPIRVSIGRPYADGKGAWACAILLEGLDSKERTIYGENSMQALCLALGMIRFHLSEALRLGNRLVYAGEDADCDCDVDVLFGLNIGKP